ncbi:putative lysozyme-like protein [Schistocerca piceifrons]|uniref:putative lysozyme-like protein n=1 Tax=Schistocerca piceifrons TaxID=274613 RepID=UPI001F5E44C9|nr:putative lysozyme-like protein [Schistocerca piceifrons]
MSRLPLLVCLAGCVVSLVSSLPLAPEQQEVVQLPLDIQEALAKLQLAEQSYEEETPRDKRTIGVLRQLFPGLSQIIDRKIQMITQYLFRVIGRLVLRGGLLGGGNRSGGGSSGDGGSRRISITLPTYPPFEEEEGEDTEQPGTESSDVEELTSPPTELNPEENQLSGAESQQSEVRVQYGEDQELAASGGNSAPSDNAAPAPAADADSEEADRNKRLINFGFGASAGTGGSGGGSGNFLFDIIRRTADRAARAAGTVYRVVAGTESLGLGVATGTKTTTSSRTNQTTVTSLTTNNATPRALVAGSGNTEPSGESASASAGASADAGVVRDDGYQAGVPGPITRLFIIANRGIANLMQDLILRLAQTSERIVNFKARLITSII